jgi:ATP-binding cassette subfamily B protein
MCWNEHGEEATYGNRLFDHFGFIGMDEERSIDVRMNDQQKLIGAYWSANSTFGVNGPVAKAMQGKTGICAGLGVCIATLITGSIYVFTCLKAWGGAFDVGSITQYVGAATAMVGNVFALTSLTGVLKTNADYLDKTFAFLDIPNAMYQGSLTTEKRSDRRYEVEFRDVSFKYPGSDLWALRHVNMKFKVGKRLAIVGENGSGKTTFIKLLCRLYDPQEGEILLNGIDIRKYRYDDYMNIFSVVFQDFQLLCRPLGENVAGSMEYDRERVQKALIEAGFGERLKTMEKGLDTMLYKQLSEDGVDVSGGEAQKIAIARALYKDAPFIILDEPTAALDPIAEAEIYAKFDQIVGDKTAIYISHRLSSCKFCDEIAVFHEGAVIQQGTHASLVAEETGKYYELWYAQAQYYTE